ncbi:MAG: hypothetical protein ABI679_12250 [Gemmatimonadota bacterium]
MDPQLSGFALGLLFAAAKVGAIGTIACGIGWWRTHRKLSHLQATLPDPGRLDERLANLEQASDYTISQLTELTELQDTLLRQLGGPGARMLAAETTKPGPVDPLRTPR